MTFLISFPYMQDQSTGLYDLSFGYAGPCFHLHQTKNARFAKFAHVDYVEFNCRKRTRMQSRATLEFVFTVEKSGLYVRETNSDQAIPDQVGEDKMA